jgi:2-iminobutanoate/2-iminopropanoate deaminase
VSASDCSSLLRRFTGPEADELAILRRPDGGSPEIHDQALTSYRALAGDLAAHGATFGDLTGETLFLRDVARDLPDVLAARDQVLAEIGQRDRAPRPTFIGQPPVDAHAGLEILALGVVPRDRASFGARDLDVAPSCGCAGCARAGARLIRLGDQTTLHTANLYGAGADAYEQASAAFRTAEQLLERCGMDFHDVVRTWIQLRDIDRDYDALNTARREFFARHGVARRPASTGVGGAPFPDAHLCSLSLQAVKSPRGRDVTGMSTPLLNEAWSYGADFSRGLRVVEANKVALHVSGTASIDEEGRTVHARDVAAQAERMLDNIASLLERNGASFASLTSGITYLRHASDGPALRALYRRRGFDAFPLALVVAPLCRRDLLCETEVVAMLPRAEGPPPATLSPPAPDA